jgi:hypothetical protein
MRCVPNESWQSTPGMASVSLSVVSCPVRLHSAFDVHTRQVVLQT